MRLRFENTLTTADLHRHIPHAFDVPPGTTEIRMTFSYEPRFSAGQEFHNQMSLSVADPTGPRGVYYLIRDYGIRINAVDPTPGFRAGPLHPGTWVVEVDTYRLLPPDAIRYVIDVTLSSEALTAPAREHAPKAPRPRGPGWYRGDLHAHSLHSDASWDVPDLVAYARQRGWDFVTLTDHNTVSGLPQHASLADDRLLTMGGLELTTYYGHAVVLGTDRWFEWRLDTDARHTMPFLAQQVLDAGAFFIIAHPEAPGDPECSGCHWEYEDMTPGNAPAVEIWNGSWSPYNELSLQLYYRWLNAGHRLVATGGTDMHGDPGSAPLRQGTNAVYAEELSGEAVLSAVRRGHSYLTAGPELIFTGRTESGAHAINGDVLPDEPVTLAVAWSGAHPGDVLRLIVDGRVHDQRPAGETGDAAWPLARGSARWCTVELRDEGGRMWAVANPIFIGWPAKGGWRGVGTGAAR
jgi:hypothetical protein